MSMVSQIQSEFGFKVILATIISFWLIIYHPNSSLNFWPIKFLDHKHGGTAWVGLPDLLWYWDYILRACLADLIRQTGWYKLLLSSVSLCLVFISDSISYTVNLALYWLNRTKLSLPQGHDKGRWDREKFCYSTFTLYYSQINYLLIPSMLYNIYYDSYDSKQEV